MKRLITPWLYLIITSSVSASSTGGLGVGSDEALKRLQVGNARFTSGKCIHPNASEERRIETAQHGQHPFVTVITCSDSRCPPERLFDQGVGDVFVIRVAGNVCNTDEIGSVEYGVGHLGTSLVVLLGHSQCGAVTAVATGAKVHGCIAPLVEGIGPAVKTAQKKHPDLKGKDLVPAAIEANVWQGIDDLFRRSSEIRELVRAGKVKVVGAIYSIENGTIRWMGVHPEQDRLLTYADSAAHGEHAATAPASSDKHSTADATASHVQAGTTSAPAASHAAGGPETLTAQQALNRLKDGNARFNLGTSLYPNTAGDRLTETAKNGQHPFATIVGCSDSRQPLEILFDRGIGDLFVVRVAGNVCGTDEIGSIEYGVGHLNTPVLLVLGHTACGAVTAVATQAEVHGNITPLVANIKPAVDAAHKAHPNLDGKDLVPAAIKANVFHSIREVFRRSPEIRERVKAGQLNVLGGIYHIESGRIDWLGEHPEQRMLLGMSSPDHTQGQQAAPSSSKGASAGH